MKIQNGSTFNAIATPAVMDEIAQKIKQRVTQFEEKAFTQSITFYEDEFFVVFSENRSTKISIDKIVSDFLETKYANKNGLNFLSSFKAFLNQYGPNDCPYVGEITEKTWLLIWDTYQKMLKKRNETPKAKK